MRYWITLDSIFKRIVRISADLSGAMRAFSFTFILGLMFRPSFPIEIGSFSFDRELVNLLSKPVLLFIVLDIIHPLFYLVSLHIVHLANWKQFKKYNGLEGEIYSEQKDDSELVIKPNWIEIMGINYLPDFLLFCKIIIVVWILLLVIFKIQVIAV